MKKSELSFKCVTATEGRTTAIVNALLNKGQNCCDMSEIKDAFFVYVTNGRIEIGKSSTGFYMCDDVPEVSLPEALKLIESIEPDAPEFDIKPFDRVLIKMKAPSHAWEIDIYREIYRKEHSFVCMHTYPEQIVKYEGNEHFFDEIDMPKSWWECENGKPVWKTK